MSGAALFALALYALTIVLGWYSLRAADQSFDRTTTERNDR